MTSKILREQEETDEVRLDNQRIKEFKKGKGHKIMDKIVADDNKRLDQLHSDFVEENNISDLDKLQLIKKVFDFLKEK